MLCARNCCELDGRGCCIPPNQVEPRLFVPIRTSAFRVNKLFVAGALVHLARP